MVKFQFPFAGVLVKLFGVPEGYQDIKNEITRHRIIQLKRIRKITDGQIGKAVSLKTREQERSAVAGKGDIQNR